MNKNNKFVIVLAVLSLYVLMGYFYIYQNTQVLMKEKYKETSIKMKNTLATLIQEKKEAILLISLTVSHDKEIIQSLIKNDSTLMQLDSLSNTLKENSSLKNIWFQVIDKQGISLYRNWTNKKGDNLLKARLDVVQMIKDPKVISSISTGKFDMTFKTMVPVYKDEKFIGIVETIARFNSIAVKMNELGNETLILVDKSYKKQLTKAFTNTFIGDYYVANVNADKNLLDIYKKDYNDTLLNLSSYLVDKNNSILFTTYHLLDLNKKKMGYFILAKNLSDIDMQDIELSNKKIIYALIVLALIIIGFSYYIYAIKYQKFIEYHNEKLEEDVRSRTKELEHVAHHDALTNLPNRVLFLDRLRQSLIYSKRNKVNTFVLFLDLDRFKEVNDTYGHDIGDELLKKVAQRLKNSLRNEDTVARLGGDEFTIIVRDVTYNNMLEIAKKIIDNMKIPFFIGNLKLYSTFSIGISSYPNDGENAEDLLKYADTAMYTAKETGKNNFRFYNEEMSELTKERITLERDIKSALDRHEFEVYFQPKINATTDKVIGLEALIRWNHPSKGLVFPDSFIPFAEETGLVKYIDKFMRKETLKITKKWLDLGIDFGKVSFNASVVDLHDFTYVESLKNEIDEIGYDASLLELEILESQSMKEEDKVVSILKEIKTLGVKITVDDFGTGYSSLSYIKNLPIDKLKIDRSFVKDLPLNKDSIAIVRTIITLAKNLNLEVVAEGVETETQVKFLLNEGCEEMQGYYYSKPISAKELEKQFFKID